MSLAGVQGFLAVNERAESLVLIGAWAGAYYAVHRLTYAASLRLSPPLKEGATLSDGVDLDAPQPKYSGATLRKIVGARAASFGHALGSFGYSLRVVSGAWGALRLAHPRLCAAAWPPGLSDALRGVAPFLDYGASNALPGARGVLCHSLGYFVQELVHVMNHEPDPVFIAHHLAYVRATKGCFHCQLPTLSL